MNSYAVINRENLHVESIYHEKLRKSLLLDFPVEKFVHLIVPDEMSKKSLKAIKNNEEYELLVDEERVLKNIRYQRNILLDKTDKYVTIPDWPHPTEEVKQAWLDYRQSLRDLPANTTDPENPVWPSPP
jgi:hypothetical protein